MFRPLSTYPVGMHSPVSERADALAWDVVTPHRPSRTAGVTMAGFRDWGRVPEGHRLIPHPGVTLVLDFGAGPPVVDDLAGRQHRGNLVAGLGLGDAVWVRGENLACIQVRLTPVIAGAVLGLPLAELDGTLVTLEGLWGREASRISEALHEAPSWEQRFALVDALLASRREMGPSVGPEVAWAWNQIVASGGRARIDRLATDLGWSRKRLWSRFRAQIGVPPKRAARLIRFDHVAHRLAAGHDAALVAVDGGYTDQSHLHRDVMAFTGVTPRTVTHEPFLAVDDTAWPSLRMPGRPRH